MWGLERSALCSWGSNGAVIQSAECAVVAVVAVAVDVDVAVAVAVAVVRASGGCGAAAANKLEPRLDQADSGMKLEHGVF